MFEKTVANERIRTLIAKSASANWEEARPYMYEIAKAAEEGLRPALFAGDVASEIFTPKDFTDGSQPEFELDPVAPGMQKDFVAYTIPNQGYIPQRHIEGDNLIIPTYRVGNSQDWLLRYAERSRLDVVQKANRLIRAGFTKKLNDDAWHAILAAGLDRGVVVYDSDAGSGQFTKRLVSLMQTVMSRGSGGNGATPNRRKLTDIYLSPEAIEDMRNWGVDIVDEVTRRDIFNSNSDTIMRIFGVNLHRLDELGEGQEYQNFYLQGLGGLIQANDLELVVGLDLSNRAENFIMPVEKELELFPDPVLHREQRAGIYGWWGYGLGILDNRDIVLGSL